MKSVAMMLKAIHAQESKEATREKAAQVAAKLKEMKLSAAAKKVQDGINTYAEFVIVSSFFRKFDFCRLVAGSQPSIPSDASFPRWQQN